MMKYAFRCPVCGHDLNIEADSDTAAVERLTTEAKAHMKNHPDSPSPSEDSLRQDIRDNMRRQ